MDEQPQTPPAQDPGTGAPAPDPGVSTPPAGDPGAGAPATPPAEPPAEGGGAAV